MASPVQVEEVNPAQVPPEPATHEVENVVEEPQYGDLPDMVDYIIMDEPENLFSDICSHIAVCLERTGRALPAEWSYPHFARR